MIFKQSNLIIALSIGLQIQSGNVNAFGLSDVTNAVDQVNSVAKQLNVPQPIPTTPTPTATASTITEIPNEFQGKWVTNQSNCIGNPDEVIGFDVSKNDISYGTSWGGKIKSIKWITQGTSIEVTSEDCEDGDCQTVIRNLSLSNTGNALSVSNSAGVVEKYSRCGGVSGSSEAVTPITSASEGKILFSCKAKKGKEIRLVDKGATIEYSFGIPNKKSDILVSVPREKATTNFEIHEDYELEKFGSGSYFSVNVPNGNTKYSIYFSYGYAKDQVADEGGVSVIVNKKYVNSVKCIGNEITNNLENVDLKFVPN